MKFHIKNIKYQNIRLPFCFWSTWDVLQRTGPFFITDRYLEFRRSHPESSKSILHAPAAHFSPLMDKQAISGFDNFCNWHKGNRLRNHPLVIRGCNWWSRQGKILVQPKVMKKARGRAFLVHRFLHLGYLVSQKIGLMKQFSVCDVIPIISRYGLYDLNASLKWLFRSLSF